MALSGAIELSNFDCREFNWVGHFLASILHSFFSESWWEKSICYPHGQHRSSTGIACGLPSALYWRLAVMGRMWWLMTWPVQMTHLLESLSVASGPEGISSWWQSRPLPGPYAGVYIHTNSYTYIGYMQAYQGGETVGNISRIRS